MISSSRRGFLRGFAGVSLLSTSGCFTPHPRKPSQKVRLAAVGIMGKGYGDWILMLKTGLVEMVAFCDADANMLTQALEKAKNDLPGLVRERLCVVEPPAGLVREADDVRRQGLADARLPEGHNGHLPLTRQREPRRKGVRWHIEWKSR